MKGRPFLVGISMLVLAAEAHAQGAAATRAAMRAARRAEQQERRAAMQNPSQPIKRQELQQQVRRTLWRVTKQRIGFTDEQMLRLERTSQRFDQERRQLAVEEKSLRVSLRREILADSTANQSVIASALDRLHVLQQRRLDLQADEQHEFSGFMTPLQRARFAALQEQVRKRLLEFDRARAQPSADALGTAP